MNKLTKIALIFTAYAIIISLIIVFYTIPRAIELGGMPYPSKIPEWVIPKTWSEIEFRINLFMITYLSVGILLIAMALITLNQIRVMHEEEQKIPFYTLFYFFLFQGTASFIIALGEINFILLKKSYDLSKPLGLLYPVSLPIGMMLAGLASYYVLAMGYILAYHSDVPKKFDALMFTLLTFLFAILIDPYNWFGMVGPPDLPDMRVFSNGLLLLVNLVAILIILPGLRKALKEARTNIRKLRLKLLMIGYITLVGFYLSYTLDAITRYPYSPFMILGFIFAIFTATTIYLAIMLPEWFTKRVLRQI